MAGNGVQGLVSWMDALDGHLEPLRTRLSSKDPVRWTISGQEVGLVEVLGLSVLEISRASGLGQDDGIDTTPIDTGAGGGFTPPEIIPGPTIELPPTEVTPPAAGETGAPASSGSSSTYGLPDLIKTIPGIATSALSPLLKLVLQKPGGPPVVPLSPPATITPIGVPYGLPLWAWLLIGAGGLGIVIYALGEA